MDHGYDEHETGMTASGGGLGRLSVPQSAEEARRKYEQMKADNLYSIKNIGFETDENGQTTLLGLPVSGTMRPVLEMALDSVKPFIIDQSDRVEKVAANLAKRVGFAKSHAALGVAAENIFRWGIVGSKQIFDVVRYGNRYAAQRRELFATLSPVMQATGANLHNNEVIKAAYDDLHNNWVTDMKKLAADLPSLVPTAVFAWEDQMASAKRRASSRHAADAAGKSVEELRMQAGQQLSREISEARELERVLDEQRKIHMEDAKNIPNITQAELERAAYAFDHDVAPGIRARHHRKAETQAEEHRENKPKNTDKLLMGVIPITAFISQAFKSDIEEQAALRRRRVKAWKMIEHLKAEMESRCGDQRGRDGYEACERHFTSRPPEEITLSGMGSRKGEMLNLKEYIVEVFQQHERDREPGRNFYDKKTGRAIDPLKGSMLTQLMPAVEIIAGHIADGTLSGDALYKLVGEHKVIQHSPSGARVFVKEDALRKVIDTELVPVLGTREVMKIEEFTAKFADPALIQDTLRKNLESMKGREKALFASLFPDDILVQAGMKKQDILAARKEAHAHACDFLAATALHLSQKSEEALKAMGVTEHEAGAIHSLAQKVQDGDMKALKLAVDGRDKTAVDAVRTAGLLEQVQQGGVRAGYWTERVKEMGAAHAAIVKNSAARAAAADMAAGDDRLSGSRRERQFRDDLGGDRESGQGSDRGSDRGNDFGRQRADRREDGFSDRFDPETLSFSARERLDRQRGGARGGSPDMQAV